MTRNPRKKLSEEKVDWGVGKEESELNEAISESEKEASILDGIDKEAAEQLVNKMTQTHTRRTKRDTTRFTFDLEADLQTKLNNLAIHTNRSKASVLKFLIKQAHKALE